MEERYYSVRILKEGHIPIIGKTGPIKNILLSESWIKLLARLGIPLIFLHVDNSDPIVEEVNNIINNSLSLSNPNNTLRYDIVQNLTNSQKTIVRNNIDAISMTDVINHLASLNFDKYVDDSELVSEINQVENRCNIYTNTKITQLSDTFNNSFASKQYVDTKIIENNDNIILDTKNYTDTKISQLDNSIINRHYTKQQDDTMHSNIINMYTNADININNRITNEVSMLNNEIIKRLIKSNNLSDLPNITEARDNLEALYKYSTTLKGNTVFWNRFVDGTFTPGFYFCQSGNSVDLPVNNTSWFIFITEAKDLNLRIALLFSTSENINAIYAGTYNYLTNTLIKNICIYHMELGGIITLTRNTVKSISYPSWFVREDNSFNFKLHISLPNTGNIRTINKSTIMNNFDAVWSSTLITNVSYTETDIRISGGGGITAGINFPIIIYFQRLGGLVN